MRRLFEEKKGEVCSVIIEPLVQCAGSMAMYDATYITKLRALCDEYDVHLIADEIAVGFGRTGTLFACEQAAITPDFMCLSKGITGGYLPLSVTMLTDEIYQDFYCDYNEGKSFLDSHSYTGNTLACAAANATLDIFEDENVVEKNRNTAALMATLLSEFETLKHVKEIRQRGMIAAIELESFPSGKRLNLEMYQYALKHEVLLRPLGNVVYFMPPYTMNEDEITKMFTIAREAIEQLDY